MNQLRCQHEYGWAGIAAALVLAQSGDEITIEPGDYLGSESLHLPEGVTLRGSDDPNNPTRLYFGGASHCIRLASDCAISHLVFDVDQTCGPQSFDHVDALGANNFSVSNCQFQGRTRVDHGVYAHQARRLRITNCAYIGFKQCALHLTLSEGCVDDCKVRKNRTGLTLARSTLKVANTYLLDNRYDGLAAFSSDVELDAVDCSRNGTNGIRLTRSSEDPERKSSARITMSVCNDNTGCGIVLLSTSANIRASECCRNQSFGVAMLRDSRCPGEASEASIQDNRCNNNTHSGITVLSGAADIKNNDCCDNTEFGIVLARDTDSPTEGSQASIHNNRCNNNTLTGIVVQSGSADINGNDCCGSESSGITLYRDEQSPTEASQASIHNNVCNGNTLCGIVVHSGSADIRGNDCNNNQGPGIALTRDSESPGEPSEASITNNHCSNNQLPGIAIQSGSAEITGNDCNNNQGSGIALTRDSDSPGEASEASITNNHCSKNALPGIAVESGSAVIHTNDCTDNQGSGIALLRDSKSPDQASEASITNNHCSNNQLSGIAIQSGSAEITGNDCNNNQGSGIVLARDSASPDNASEASITNNHCSNNALPGIAVQSGTAKIDGNDCSDNQASGIALTRDSGSPGKASEASIANNHCSNNALTGIAVQSGSAEINGNNCSCNQESGIALIRDSKSPVEASEASITNNHCSNNALPGIAVQSGSAVIHSNDCTDNQGSGIALLRDSNSPDEASEASITSNHCNGNELGGIAVQSGIAKIDGNDCSGNQSSGIALTRDYASPDNASEASINDNRCDGNIGVGIVAFASKMELANNYCWNNRVDRPCIEKFNEHSAIGAIEHSHFSYSPAPLEEIAQMRLAARHNAALIKSLVEAGTSDPEDIAGYLWSGGNPATFAKLWHPHLQSNAERSNPTAWEPTRRGAGVSRISFNQNGLRMERVPDPNAHRPETALARLLTSLQARVTSPRIVHGTISATTAQLQEAADFWRQLKNYRDIPEASNKNNLRIIQDNQYRVADPIVTIRSPADSDSQQGIFSDVLADRSNTWADRFRLLSIPWFLVLTAITVLMVVIFGQSNEPFSQWTSANQLSLLVAGLITPGALIFASNLLLPRELRIRIPIIERATNILSALFDLKVLDNVRELLAEQQESIDRFNWWRWAKPHLLGPSLNAPHLLFVGIGSIDIWSEGDLWRLRRLLDSQYPEQGLMLAIQTTDHSMVPSAVLRVLYEQRDGDWKPRHALTDLLLIETAGNVSLIEETESHELENDDGSLDHILGTIADRATLLHPRWSIVDLLPALVLGSQTEAQVFFAFSKVQAFELIEPDLKTALSPMAELFSDSPQELQIDAATFANVLRSAEESMAVLISQSQQPGSQPKLTLAGLASYRRNLANQLMELSKGDEEQAGAAAGYVAKCLAWAEERNLRRALHHLSQISGEADKGTRQTGSHEFALRTSWHMRAAGRLAAERQVFARRSHQKQTANEVNSYVEQAWTDIANAMCLDPAHNQIVESGHVDTLAGSFLSAVAKAQESDALDFPEFQNERIEQKVLANLAKGSNSKQEQDGMASSSIVGCFLTEARQTLEALVPIDRSLANTLLQSKLTQDWYWAPGYLTRACADFLAETEANSLSNLLRACESPEDVVVVARQHRSDASRIGALLVGIAARHLRFQRDREGAPKANDQMRALGIRLSELVSTLERPDENPIRKEDFLGVPFWLKGAGAVVEALLDEDYFREISDALSEPAPMLNPQILGFALGPMTGVTGVIDDLIAIERRL